MSLTLALERAVAPGSWALFENDELCAAATFTAAGGGPRTPAWSHELQLELKRLGVAPQQLDLMVAGLGPGSFSGIRAALAWLQGVALPHKLQLVGLSTAAVIASNYLSGVAAEEGAEEGATVAVVGDARHGFFWYALYRSNREGRLLMAQTGTAPTHSQSDFMLLPYENLAAAIPAGATIISPEPERLRPYITTLSQHPTATVLARLYFSDRGAARHEPLPLYLNPAVRV